MRYRRGLELRLFDYAARLRVQLRLPVATTVLLLQPPAPRRLRYSESVGGRIVCERRFDALRLWELDPEQLLAMGAGPATLVGRARAAGARHVRAAARLIAATTSAPDRNDLLFILQALCGERYTPRELGRMIPKEAVMASVMFAKEFRQARAEARAEGRAEGRVEEARVTCLDIVRLRHPAAVGTLAPAVAACQSLPTLRAWTLAAAKLPSARLVKLVSVSMDPRKVSISRRSAPRPSRRSVSRRRP